jgi:hypothetical protein
MVSSTQTLYKEARDDHAQTLDDVGGRCVTHTDRCGVHDGQQQFLFFLGAVAG